MTPFVAFVTNILSLGTIAGDLLVVFLFLIIKIKQDDSFRLVKRVDGFEEQSDRNK